MTKHTQLMIGMFVVGVIIGIGIISGNSANAPTENTPTIDPRSATFLIDGQTYTLRDGKTEVSQFPDAMTTTTVVLSGDSMFGDVNRDGSDDLVQVVTFNGGGSGTFYYLALVLAGNKDVGSAIPAVFLGDRIAIENVALDALGVISVTYADRHDDEPMTVTPSVGVSKRFVLEGDSLREVTE